MANQEKNQGGSKIGSVPLFTSGVDLDRDPEDLGAVMPASKLEDGLSNDNLYQGSASNLRGSNYKESQDNSELNSKMPNLISDRFSNQNR